MQCRPFLGSQCLSVFFRFRNPEELAEFPGGRRMLGLAVGQMVLCTAFGHSRNCPTGHIRHVKFIDALLVGQEQKLPSCWLGVLGSRVISVPGFPSLIKRAPLQTFLSLRSLRRAPFSLLPCLFSVSNSDPPHRSSLSGL